MLTDPLHVLFVTPYVPSLLRPRPFHFVRGLLARGHAVDVAALAATNEESRDAERLEAEGVRTHVVRPRSRLRHAVRPWLTQGLPLHVAYFESAEMSERLAGLAVRRDRTPDIVHVEHVRAARYGLGLPVRAKVLDAVDCHTRLLEAAAERGPTWRHRLWARADLARTRALERSLLREYPAVVVTSDRDRRSFEELGEEQGGGASLHVLENGVDLDAFSPAADAQRQPDTLVFVGRLGYHANRRALRRLLAEIMPLVWRNRPQVRLTIVGEAPPAFVRRAARRWPGKVVVTGRVPDVRPYLAEASVAVCPMPYAVGIQNKVLEAMATETAVVADPPACAALAVESGQQILIAPSPEEFADATLRLLADDVLRRRIARAGRAYVERHHRWGDVVARLEALYVEQVGAPRIAAGGRA